MMSEALDMVNLTILGSTGSIGCSALEGVRQNHDRFNVFSLVAGRNSHLVLSQIQEFLPKVVVVADDIVKNQLADGLAKSGLEQKYWPELLSGAASRVAVARAGEVGTVISAIVGITGLEATYEAIKAGKRV